MKKSELNLVSVGSEIKSKKTNEVLTVNNITEFDSKIKYQLSNGKTTTQSSLLRWYELQSVEPVATKPVEVKPVEPQIEVKPDISLLEQIVEYCKDKYIVKHNSDHIVVKGSNKKNLVEIHSSKRAINLVVRHQLYSEEEQMLLNNCRIVGNGTYVLDLKFEITQLNEFITALNRASEYVPVKKSKK